MERSFHISKKYTCMHLYETGCLSVGQSVCHAFVKFRAEGSWSELVMVIDNWVMLKDLINVFHQCNVFSVVKLSDDFNGADLRNVCTEAGMFAIRAERDYVVEEDFMKAVRKVRWSHWDRHIPLLSWLRSSVLQTRKTFRDLLQPNWRLSRLTTENHCIDSAASFFPGGGQ